MSLMMYVHLHVNQAIPPSLYYRVSRIQSTGVGISHSEDFDSCLQSTNLQNFVVYFVLFFPGPQRHCSKPTRVAGCHLHNGIVCFSVDHGFYCAKALFSL